MISQELFLQCVEVLASSPLRKWPTTIKLQKRNKRYRTDHCWSIVVTETGPNGSFSQEIGYRISMQKTFLRGRARLEQVLRDEGYDAWQVPNGLPVNFLRQVQEVGTLIERLQPEVTFPDRSHFYWEDAEALIKTLRAFIPEHWEVQ